MKISRNWLSDFIEWKETDPAVIADEMTRCMGEVDEVLHQGRFLENVVVGHVVTLGKHPDADKLSVCTIATDRGTKNVVCGGTNLRQGMLVAFAHVGATVKAGEDEVLTLKKMKIRGVESEGMVCAAEELELEGMFPPSKNDGARPILNLSSLPAARYPLSIGTPLRETLSINDVIFHIDNHAITNRADLFSHIGVARELVAMGLAKWKKKVSVPTPAFSKTKLPFTLKNDVPALVPAYEGCMLAVEDLPPTPDWMKRRLEATGWRCINLVVDITNYVLMETGMPLHAFDADDFRGTLHIRAAKKGEKITTLDDAERALPEGAVVISDEEGIFDLFGVMGGLRTSNKPETKNIFLQAGIIDPLSVRSTILKMGHRTDAATVYEKGLNLSTAKLGLARAIELFRTISPETKVSSAPLQWGKEKPRKAITIPSSLFGDFLGIQIESAEVKSIFKNLGFELKASGKNFVITPPVWRSDVGMKQDLIEEVARMHRYAKIVPVMPSASIAPPARDHRTNGLRDTLREKGYIEFLHLAFGNADHIKKCGLDVAEALRLKNPIGEEMALMRTSLLPALLETIVRELRTRNEQQIKAYEYGHTFRTGKPETTELTIVVASRVPTTLPASPTLVAKDALVETLKENGYTARVEKSDGKGYPFAHPGRTASVEVQGKNIGIVTELHPAIAEAFGLRERTGIATINLDTLLALQPETKVIGALPVFPSVTFDETMDIGASVFEKREKAARALDPLLRSVAITNLYEKEDERKITLRFEYRADDRTLTLEEAEAAHAKVAGVVRKG